MHQYIGYLCRLKKDNYPSTEHRIPEVLVTEDTGIAGAVRVAQIGYGTNYSTGDILLDDNLFVESWNTYPALADDLDILYKVSEDILKDVLIESEKQMLYIDQKSKLYQFRKEEIRVSSFFGKVGACKALSIIDKA